MKFILAAFILLSVFFSQAQKRPIKFGNVSKEELEETACPIYPDAKSMILANFADMSFLYSNEKGFRYQFEETKRVKIYKIEGKEEANVSLRVYDPVSGSGKEDIVSIKAFTYNLVDGKVEKTKLANDEEFVTRINDYWLEISFAMPNIQEGSVFEYSYYKTSDYYSNLQPWHFQYEIPVGYSDLKVTIPEYFDYQINQVGNIIPVEFEEKPVEESFTIVSAREVGDLSTQSSRTQSITSSSKFKSFVAKNIEPLEEEPFMNNKVNLPSRVEFQLMRVIYPNSPIKNIAGNYDNFNTTLLERENFGKALNNGNFAKEKIQTLDGIDQIQKANSIYNWIHQNIVWNDVYAYSSNDAGRKAFSEKSGTIADINLTLLAVFREAGLDAHPVLLSTRGHGVPHPAYPNFTDFNYVIAAVSIDANIYLCDATSNLPFGALPYRCLNGNGWMVTKDGGEWINLKSGAEHKSAVYASIFVEEDQIINKIESKNQKYAAYATYSSYKEKGHENFQDDLSKNFNEWTLNELEFNESNSDTLNFSFEIAKDFNGEDILYIQPILYGAITENPFVREKRMSSIDFPYKRKTVAMTQIKIPEGYEAELPTPAIIKLPENNATFYYSASLVGGVVNVLSNFTLTKQDFSPEDYLILKQFYQLMSEKNNELIILKKI